MKLICCGFNVFRQLNNYDDVNTESEYINQPSESSYPFAISKEFGGGDRRLAPVNIKQVCCGLSHTLILSSDGRLFCVWGSAEGSKDVHIEHVLRDKCIVQIDSKFDLNGAIDESGHLFLWGRVSNADINVRTEGSSSQIIFEDLFPGTARFSRVAVGEKQAFCITTQGELCSISFMRSGSPASAEAKLEVIIKREPAFAGQRMKEVACGSSHTIAINERGQVFAYGWNGHGQCGEGSTTSKDLIDEPETTDSESGTHLSQRYIIEQLDGIRIRKAACGASHTILLSDTGDVYGMGSNEHGQLGLGPGKANDQFQPMLIEKYTDDVRSRVETTNAPDEDEDSDTILEDVVDIAAGSRHSVFITGNGTVFTTGFNKFGQLGTGDFANRLAPHKVFKFETPTATTTTTTQEEEEEEEQRFAVACGQWSSFFY